jgi:hypothetical protein
MTKTDLRNLIRSIAQPILKTPPSTEIPNVEYEELEKFPELKKTIIDLLTQDYARFLDGLDWVAPRPTTFRVNLLNGQNFYLIYGKRSWIAQVEGKKYYLLNLPEEERAAQAIARVLRYGTKEEAGATETGGAELGGETPPAEETPTETPPAEETPEA